MYEQAEAVRPSFSGPGSGHTSGPPQTRPVHQGGSRGHVRQGNGAPDKQPEDDDASSHTYEEAEAVRCHAAYMSTDRTYPGGASGRRGVCSFLRAHLSCLTAGIAVLLSLVSVGLAPLTFINKQEISQLSTTFDAVKRDQYNMSTTVDALKRDQDGMSTTVDALKRDLDNERSRITALEKRLHEIDSDKPQDCQDILDNDETTPSGVYMVYPRDNLGGFNVFCDMDTDGGGWTLFQRRRDGSVDFYRGWADYKTGFPSNLNGEFWLGNDNLYRLAVQKVYQLRVDMEDVEGETRYAAYDTFAISPESQNYKLHIGTYSGTAGDSLTYHDGKPFSTKDRDNDEITSSCAQDYKGAWWYKRCHSSNLNGLYHLGTHEGNNDGVYWQYWKGNNYSLKSTEMKLRPAP
ncbi:Fibrinogen C domain-containing protein 1 [Branchiostoma belcheri]|nr:Fibrinogen C domain-containing protein 1 [Branchiostoma belcheri]